MIIKWKCGFRKRDLRRSENPWITSIRFVSPSSWCGMVARHRALSTHYRDLALDFSWYGNVIVSCWVQTRRKESFGLNICKSGRQELVYSERLIYHRGRDGDDRLVSRDVHGWWVAGGIFGRATEITTWQQDLVLC